MDCSKVICCREYDEHSVGEGVKSPAEKVRILSSLSAFRAPVLTLYCSQYGHKKCDTPPALVESMFGAIERFVARPFPLANLVPFPVLIASFRTLRYAPNRHFTIFTGDVVESAVWAVDEPVRPLPSILSCDSDRQPVDSTGRDGRPTSLERGSSHAQHHLESRNTHRRSTSAFIPCSRQPVRPPLFFSSALKTHTSPPIATSPPSTPSPAPPPSPPTQPHLQQAPNGSLTTPLRIGSAGSDGKRRNR